MNRYIIAVIWKTYDQLWNPKLENIKIWKTYDQLWNPKSENCLIFTNQFYLYIFWDKRIRFMKESTSI